MCALFSGQFTASRIDTASWPLLCIPSLESSGSSTSSRPCKCLVCCLWTCMFFLYYYFQELGIWVSFSRRGDTHTSTIISKNLVDGLLFMEEEKGVQPASFCCPQAFVWCCYCTIVQHWLLLVLGASWWLGRTSGQFKLIASSGPKLQLCSSNW